MKWIFLFILVKEEKRVVVLNYPSKAGNSAVIFRPTHSKMPHFSSSREITRLKNIISP